MPIIQLSFGNPLNVSVQIGDVAYFCNPHDVGSATTANNMGQWASTVTPHQTASQAQIIKIGEITDIQHDYPNPGEHSITCNMPQDLFNLYYKSISREVCTTVSPAIPFETNVIPGISIPTCNGMEVFKDLTALMTEAFTAPNHSTEFKNIGAYNLIAGGVNPTGWNPGFIFDDTVNNGCLALTRPDGTSAYPSPARVGKAFGGHKSAAETITHFNNAYTFGLSTTASFVDFKAKLDAELPNASFGTSATSCCAPLPGTTTCTDPSFIMFSKDNKANLAHMLGYYASVEFRNDSQEKAELFNVGARVVESSK